MRLPILLLLVVLSDALAVSRDVNSMSGWAQRQGVKMHENLQWKQYDPEDDSNWGLELKEPVPPGTTLLQVPCDLVLDSNAIYEEFKTTHGEKLTRALELLGDFAIHKEIFFIILKLLQCSQEGEDSRWAPWIEGMPKTFPEYTKAEKACLPYYAKFAVVYQQQKFKAFCQAAEELLDDWKQDDPHDIARLLWAFNAVSSRCWTTAPQKPEDADKANTELVPIGDMFNHREPPNVALTHEDGSVNFVYRGDTTGYDEKDLYITYGSPSNPHRFLAIFGFVPDMPNVWSHLVIPNNPFAEDASKMVFRTANGEIPEAVWDAVLYSLLQRKGITFESYAEKKEELYDNYKFAASAVLKNHVTKLLEELAELRQRIDVTDGENMDLIRQHNEFLALAFAKVLEHLGEEEQ